MVTFRPAQLSDSYAVAKGVTMALHLEEQEQQLRWFEQICRRDDVLYSWRNALLAEEDGQVVGLCLCYDGADYHETRLRTFALLADGKEGEEDNMDLAHFEDETGPGEYYIDSLAVWPEYRRRGIARQLLMRQIDAGRKLGVVKATLLVDPDNPSAQQLYRECGFLHEYEVYAFGQIFWKWELKY